MDHIIGTVDNVYKGLLVFPKGTSVNVRVKPSTTSAILLIVKAEVKAGTATGNYLKMADGKWFQLDTVKGTGYARQDVIKFTKPQATAQPTAQTVTDAQANDMVSKLVDSDKLVFESLIRISQLLATAKDKGKDTTAHEAKFKTLTDKLAKRQDAIKNSKVVTWKAGVKKGYDNMINWFKYLYSSISGIGVLPIVAVVVSAVVGAGLATTAYFLFKPKYSESQTDLKVSTDLENLLKKADPETAEKIKVDLEQQIDKAYNQGKTDQSFSSVWSIGKYVLIFGAGYFLVTKFVSSQSKTK